MKTYICAGIGDMVCLDCFLTQEERNSITEIYWGSRFGKDIAPLIQDNFFYKNIKNQYFIDDETGKQYWQKLKPNEPQNWTFWHFRSDVPQDYHTALAHYSLTPDQVQDFTPISFFNDVNRNYTGSSFLMNASKADVEWDKIGITPGKYILVHYPTSSRPRNDIATINNKDWEQIKLLAKEKNLPVVVISDIEFQVPFEEVKVLIKPDIKSVIALAKYAEYYVGCDSFVSILCAKVMAANKMLIKSPRPNITEMIPGHIWNHKYFSPHKPNVMQRFYRYEPCG